MKKKVFTLTFQWITYFLVYTWSTVFSEFTVKPQNSLAELGKETSLQCCSARNNPVLEWHFRKGNDGNLFNKLCSRQTCHGEGYAADNFSRDCSRLNINASSVEVAGLYMCSELGTGDRCAAYLVTYQFNCSQNISSTNKLDDGLKVVVTLWHGKLPLEMVLTTASGNKMQRAQFSQTQDVYRISLPVDPTSIPPSYTFSIQLLSSEISDECIDVHSPVVYWSLPKEQMMYTVTNVRTNCAKKDCEKKKGEVINCSADGFPLPTFLWLDWDLKPVGDGSVLQVNDVGSFGFICISRNTVNGQEHEAREKIWVTVPEEISMSTIIGLFLVLVVISIHFIIVVLEPVNIRNYIHVCAKKIYRILFPLQISVQEESDKKSQEVSKDSDEVEGVLPSPEVEGEVTVEMPNDETETGC